uniref:Transposase n=1 Tax=Loa loa TaxID=7209 RepID=A0A1I7VIY1_LOALO
MQTGHQIVAIVEVLHQFVATTGNAHKNIWRHFVVKGQMRHDELLCANIF